MQLFKSEKTSVNKVKTPAVFKKVIFIPDTANLDYGGGKYDIATEYLDTLKVKNYIFDPYNRTQEENDLALSKWDYDTATLSNVLNVIYEEDIRINILLEIKRHLKSRGKLYITVYEGDKTGVASVDLKKNTCQLNKRLKDYISEVKLVFDTYSIKNGVITCYK